MPALCAAVQTRIGAGKPDAKDPLPGYPRILTAPDSPGEPSDLRERCSDDLDILDSEPSSAR